MNQGQGIRTLQMTRESNPEVGNLLQSIRQENSAVRSLDLSSFLLEPSPYILALVLLHPRLTEVVLFSATSDKVSPSFASGM
jgi:hypothetical protein